ncbi:probable serine/threonine-protein kinase At1g54610 [Zingiber officinale]|uniref:probable serine/threonine-protein kinase At1g54610 n=1 Tax=Zingiber officinale TaxID=94328 RepID=UPI001C4C2DA9|nr:probable serine/threonine-protein kinase At1g54610 [Zingiber officinale]
MGCVQAKEASTPPSPASLSRRRSRSRGREKEKPAATAPLASGRKSQASLPRVETSIDAPDAVARQEEKEQVERPAGERQSRRRRSRPDPRLSNPSGHLHGEQVAAGWPPWLAHAAGEALQGWTPRRADSFEKIDKIGQGTYSNVYKARDTLTGKIVALKKVRFDIMEPESVKFMAREILILRHLDHPNVVKLEGLVTSRLSCSLYLVFEYMEHDLAGLISSPTIKFTVPQVKCYMHQLLSGLEHCHNNGVLHRDIKGSNLLLDNEGLLKIADFGLATFFDPNRKHPMTSRVVTLWYRPPELLLGATDYAVGVDIWSAGCILAELLAGKPIMPGRTEVEQLHKIFKLCGSPSEDYWKKSKLPHATIFKPQQPYKCCIRESFKDFPQSALLLVETLLAIDPAERQTATAALNSEFFNTEPYACDPSSLPKYPPSKEMDAKMRDEEARRLRAAGGKAQANGSQKIRTRDRAPRAVPAPEANAELQANIDKMRLLTHANAKSKSEKFPPPHQDGALGYQLDPSHNVDASFDNSDASFSTIFPYQKGPSTAWSGPLGDPAAGGLLKRKKHLATSVHNSVQSKQFDTVHSTRDDHKDKGRVRVL